VTAALGEFGGGVFVRPDPRTLGGEDRVAEAVVEVEVRVKHGEGERRDGADRVPQRTGLLVRGERVHQQSAVGAQDERHVDVQRAGPGDQDAVTDLGELDRWRHNAVPLTG